MRVKTLLQKFQVTKDLSCLAVADDVRQLCVLLQIEFRGENLSPDMQQIKSSLITKLSGEDKLV